MPTNTLTSLAILRVNINQGKDYLDYLRPFVLQVLTDHEIDPITDGSVSRILREQFGLDIPARTVAIVLKRMSRIHLIKRDHGVFHKIRNLPNSQFTQRQAEARRHIEAVVNGLQRFSLKTINPINSDRGAIDAICTFLSIFDVACLRAYLQGTAIPQLHDGHQKDVVLVSQYVQHLLQFSPERFESFIVLVQGHMLANALMCPDLEHISPTYNKVTFYFDTPLLLHGLNLEGEFKEAAARELIVLLKKLGGRIAVFSHSCQELHGVLHGVVNSLDSSYAHGIIVHEAKKSGLTRSDLLLISASIDEKLGEIGIEIDNAPRYARAFQIDESLFEKVLSDEVSYQNSRAKEHDINSVRSIYAIRANTPAPSIEKAQAVFVTSNSSFARAAWEYGQKYESSRDVSSVITSFSLANMAWLKAPLGAQSVPRTQLLAIAYAALQPSTELLNKYMMEMDSLESRGKISERDHQLLRSSPLAYDELVSLTLGDDSALTDETVTLTLERVSAEIIKEEAEKLTAELEQHKNTRDALASQQSRNRELISNIYWRSRSRSNGFATVISGMIVVALVIGLFFGPLIGLGWGSWVFRGCAIVLGLSTLMSLLFGSSVKQSHQWIQRRCLIWLLKRESAATGLDLSEWDSVTT